MRAGRIFTLWLLAMLAGIAIVWQSRFVADISFFLPSHPTVEQRVLIDQLREGAVARLLMVAIDGGTPAQRANASRDLRARLAGSDVFASVQNGDVAGLAHERDLLFRHRYLLSPVVTPERFSIEGLRAAIGNSIDLLASPAGLLLKPFLTRDPTGELYELVSRLEAGAQPDTRDGVWASRDGERAMLIAQTRALGSDTDGQETAITRIREAFSETRQAVGEPSLRIELSGPGRFAVEARATIKEEVARLSMLATLAIIAVLAAVYRSPRLISLGLLPVVSGALAGVVAVSLAYGSVFGVTVGFGSALIGEAVDYSIYYFVQSGRLGLDAWRQRFWPTVRLGVLTSVAGFAALLFSGFPGLAQLGLYALAGIVTAALVTRFVLPRLAGPDLRCSDLSGLGRKLEHGIARLQRLRVPTLLLAAAAFAFLAANSNQLWHANLSALSTVSLADAKRDAALRADLGAPDSRYLVVVTGSDREAALQAAENAGRRLDALVTQGIIGGYDSPARFLPSRKTQAERRSALPDRETLQRNLRAALADLPLRAERLAPFMDEIDRARAAPDLTPEALAGSGLALAVDALLLPRSDGWSVLLPLRPPLATGSDGAMLDIPADRVREALATSGALFIDMKAEFDALYGSYLNEAVQLSLAGFIAIILLLAAVLRSAAGVAAVLLPLLLAVLFVIAGLHLLGEPLHLIHLIGMLFIIAVGSNYALFFYQEGVRPDPGTVSSLAVANLTSVIGFGILGFSTVPVLEAIGVTVGPGVVLALMLSAMFMRRRQT